MTVDTTLVYILLYISLYFEVFLLTSFITYKKQQKHSNKQSRNKLPTATIIVPCYNEEKTLGGTLDSLLALDYPKDKLKIAVVNDGSKDKTQQIAEYFATRHSQIKVLNKKNGGKASAMNLALKHCNTELVGCLDADSFVEPNALLLMTKHFMHDSNISAVTPAIMVHKPKNILQLMQRAEYMVGVFMRRAFDMLDAIVVTPGPFTIFRREHILSISNNGTNVWRHAHGTEDYEMGLRLQHNHKKIANEPMAKVLTISPKTLYALYRQRIRWVYGFLMNTIDYRHMIGNKRYGNVGLFVLPFALISVVGATTLFGILIYKTINSLIDFYTRVSTVGISWSMFNIEWFYINTSTSIFIMLTLLSIIFTILYYSAQMSKTKVRILDTLVYILLYGFISPLWLTGATARAITKSESKWRVIR